MHLADHRGNGAEPLVFDLVRDVQFLEGGQVRALGRPVPVRPLTQQHEVLVDDVQRHGQRLAHDGRGATCEERQIGGMDGRMDGWRDIEG